MTALDAAATSPAALRLLEALAAELGADVQLHPTPAGVVMAPAVIVTPGDPWLELDGFGANYERWAVIIAATVTDPTRGVNQLWSVTNRVLTAVLAAGAVPEAVSAPDADDDTGHVTVSVPIRFKYRP